MNSKSVFAMRAIGKGSTALETTADGHVTSHHKGSLHFSQQEEVVCCLLKERYPLLLLSYVTVLLRMTLLSTITYDGTWARRGFQSLYGVVIVLSWDT